MLFKRRAAAREAPVGPQAAAMSRVRTAVSDANARIVLAGTAATAEDHNRLAAAYLDLGEYLAKIEGTQALESAVHALHNATALQMNGRGSNLARAAELYAGVLQRMGQDPWEEGELALQLYLLALSQPQAVGSYQAVLQYRAGDGFLRRMTTDKGVFEYVDVRSESEELSSVGIGSGLVKFQNLSMAAEHLGRASEYFSRGGHAVEAAQVQVALAELVLQGGSAEAVSLAPRNKWEAIQALRTACDVFVDQMQFEKLARARRILAGWLGSEQLPDELRDYGDAQAILEAQWREGSLSEWEDRVPYARVLLQLQRRFVDGALERMKMLTVVEEGAAPAPALARLQLHSILGGAYQLALDEEQSLRHYLLCIEADTQLIHASVSPESRNMVTAESQRAYVMAIRACIAQGELEKVVLLADRFVSRDRVEDARFLSRTAPAGIPVSLRTREDEELRKLRAGLSGLVDADNSFQRLNHSFAVRQCRRTLEELWQTMEGIDGTEEYLRYRRGQPLEWEEVQHWLDSSPAPIAVAAVVPHARELLVVLYVSGRKPAWMALDLGMQDLHEAVETWRNGMSPEAFQSAPAPAGFLPELEGLAKWLADMTKCVSRLYLLPTAGLYGVPIHALDTGAGPLVAHVPVAYLPSLWLLIRSAGLTRPLPDEPTAFVAGNLTEDLPDAAEEAAVVAQALDAQPRLGRNVKKEEVLTALQACDVVHIAGHGTYNLIAAMTSGIPFHGGAAVTARDVQFLSLSAPLLVLSACDLGRVRTSSGANAIGFPVACMFSGVGSALLAQWEVEDAFTRRFMQSFYVHLLANRSVSRIDPVAALRSTMLDFIAAGEPPVEWAPFAIHVGSISEPL